MVTPAPVRPTPTPTPNSSAPAGTAIEIPATATAAITTCLIMAILLLDMHLPVEQFLEMLIVPEVPASPHHPCISNQIATAIIATTIAAPTTGDIFFELPLRGESLAGWLNSVFIPEPLVAASGKPHAACPTATRFHDRRRLSTVPVARRSRDRMPESCPSDRPRVLRGFPDRPAARHGDRRHACHAPQDRISQPFGASVGEITSRICACSTSHLGQTGTCVYQRPKYHPLPQELSIDPEIRNAFSRRAVRSSTAGTAGLDDAAGRPLPAGVSRAARESGRLSRSVLYSGICRRGDAAADPPFQLRCRDHLFRHPRRPLCARPLGAVRGRRRSAARSAGYAGAGNDAGYPSRLRQTRAGV